MVDLPNEKRMCHHTGFKKQCRKLVTDGHCERWIHLQGYDVNTGVEFSESNCADDWHLKVGLENARQVKSNAAAIETQTAEMQKQHNEEMALRSDEILRALTERTRLAKLSEIREAIVAPDPSVLLEHKGE